MLWHIIKINLSTNTCSFLSISHSQNTWDQTEQIQHWCHICKKVLCVPPPTLNPWNTAWIISTGAETSRQYINQWIERRKLFWLFKGDDLCDGKFNVLGGLWVVLDKTSQLKTSGLLETIMGVSHFSWHFIVICCLFVVTSIFCLKKKYKMYF